jgi:ketosteroid isomerase-like protein
MGTAADLDLVRQMFDVWQRVTEAVVAGDAGAAQRTSAEVGIDGRWDLALDDPQSRDEWWRSFAERYWHEEIVYREDVLWPGSGEYRGREAVVARFLDYFEAFGPASVSLVDLEPAGEAVLAEWDLGTVGAGSGVPMEQRWAYVLRVRDGRVAEMSAHLDVQVARREAGLA